MPRSASHPLPLFSLLPYPKGDVRSKAVIAHPLNASFINRLCNGTPGLGIGSHIRGELSNTLAVIGRGAGAGADIIVEGSSISKIQCSFEINWDTGVVMLHDRSRTCTTYVFGDKAVPFEHGRIRRLVVMKDVNTIIGMGRGDDFVQFELEWHQDLTRSPKKFPTPETASERVVENPALAWTMDAAPAAMPSHRETRLHTARTDILKIRYAKKDVLGAGKFGTVHKAVDVDSGKLMAVKILERPQISAKQKGWEDSVKKSLKREIEVLSSLSHPNVVDYIASQGWFDSDIEIFMGLKEGDLASLIENVAEVVPIADALFPQMLEALDYLASKDIIHRDMKPENILYTSRANDQYQFQLGDFGLCNRAAVAVSISGSPLYMAPEVCRGERQSCAADVWSLYVTMLYLLNINKFREDPPRTPQQVHTEVVKTTSNMPMSQLREMADMDPLQRASAAQMLIKLFNGNGLSTPHNQVPALMETPQSQWPPAQL